MEIKNNKKIEMKIKKKKKKKKDSSEESSNKKWFYTLVRVVLSTNSLVKKSLLEKWNIVRRALFEQLTLFHFLSNSRLDMLY